MYVYVYRRKFSKVLSSYAVVQNCERETGLIEMGESTQFYRRKLPEFCTSFSSDAGKKIFKEALEQGYMNCYFPLAAQFRTQEEPAFCGLSTLVMVLNALEVDPGRVWKGPWRWYHENMLDCCAPLDVIRQKGITFKKLACLARCSGLDVEMFQLNGRVTFEYFKRLVQSATTTDDKVVVMSYSRKTLEQTGDGHFAPIGGYHPQRDLVLIMDVARFKYPPHWVSMTTMWEAMNTADSETGDPRGFCVLSVDTTRKPLIFFKLSPYCINVNEIPRQGMQTFLDNWKNWLSIIPSTGDPIELLKETLSVLVSCLKDLPIECCLHTYQVDVRCCKNKEHICAITELLGAIQKSDIYASLLPLVSKDDGDLLYSKLWGPSIESLKKSSSCNHCDLNIDAATILAVFLYSWPYNNSIADSVSAKLSKLVMDSSKKQHLIMQNEIRTLQRQWLIVLDEF